MNFWQFVSNLTGGRTSTLSPLLKLAAILVLALWAANQIPDANPTKDAIRAPIYFGIAIGLGLVVMIFIVSFCIFAFGWGNKGQTDKHALRSEAHVEKAWGHDEVMVQIEKGVFKP